MKTRQQVKALASEALYGLFHADWSGIIADGKFWRVIGLLFKSLYEVAVWFFFVFVPGAIANALIGNDRKE